MPENCTLTECPLEHRVEELEEANKRHAATHREIFGRIGSLEKEDAVQDTRYDAIIEKLDGVTEKQDRLAAKLEALERTVEKQARTLDELNERGKSNVKRLDAIEAKPGKRWEGIVDKLIWFVVCAAAGYMLARMGLSV